MHQYGTGPTETSAFLLLTDFNGHLRNDALLLHFCAGQVLCIMNTFTLGTDSDICLSSTYLFFESIREKKSRVLDWSPCKLPLEFSSSPMQTIGQKTHHGNHCLTNSSKDSIELQLTQKRIGQKRCALFLTGLQGLARSTNSSKHEIRQILPQFSSSTIFQQRPSARFL